MNTKKKLLWIKADQLYPLNSGGKIRTYNMLAEMMHEFDITYFTLKDRSEDVLGDMSKYSNQQVFAHWTDNKKSKVTLYIEALKNLLFSKLPFVIDKYTTPQITNSLQTTLEKQNYDIIISDFLSLSANLVRLKRQPTTKYIVFQHNVESYIWERHFMNASNIISRAYFKSQWRRFLRFEQKTCKWFDGVIAVSEFDENVFKKEFGLNNVLGHVETGVDVKAFSKFERKPKKHSLVFLGSMDWMPNIDGIEDFIKQTYPLIKKRLPQVTLTILGRNPPGKIIQLGQKDPSIHVTGTVDDVRPFLAEASASIVPLRIGGGTRIKIFETMAAGLPVISTTIGAEGLPITDGEHLAIADDSETFADKVITLLTDSDYASRMANNAQQLVISNFSWETVTREFVAMLNKTKQ